MVVSKLPIDIFNIILKTGKIIWNIIKGNDDKQEEISNKSSFNPEKSEASEIAELNKILLDYRQNIIDASNELERQMLIECTIQMQELMDMFEDFNKNLKIARTESIKRKFRRLNDEVKGTFADYISKRLSLDDVECVKILKLPAGDLKNERLQELKQNVFIEATNEIIKKIQNTVHDFSETIEDAFYEHLERTEISIQERADIFKKLSEETELDTENVEAVLLKANYIFSMCYYSDEI